MAPYTYVLHFDESDSTKDKLIKATQYLLAMNGYETTTTRMIANAAKVNLSAINFHFGNKENLVKVAVETASTELAEHYKQLATEIEEFLQQPEVDKEKAWEYIDRFLTQRIRRTLDGKKSFINIGLVRHESSFPESCQDIMARVAIQDNELVLADMIYYVMEKKDHFKAVLVARLLTAGMLTYMEKPTLNRELGKETGVDLEDLEAVEKNMHEYFMASIRAVASEK